MSMIKILSLTQHLKDNKYEAFSSQSIGAENLIFHEKKMHAQITWHQRTKWNLLQGIANKNSNESKGTYFENNNKAGGFKEGILITHLRNAKHSARSALFRHFYRQSCAIADDQLKRASTCLGLKIVSGQGASCFALYMPFLFNLLKNFNRSDSSGYKKNNVIIRHKV